MSCRHAAGFRIHALRQRGVTLVELIISIVVIGIAAAAILGVYTTTLRSSADPMIRTQAIAVAEMYMDEVMGRPFNGSTGDGSCGARDSWDHIGAYDGLDCSPPTAVDGSTMGGLDSYRVRVNVYDDGSLGLAGNERRIDVRVSDSAGTVDITLSGWRTP